jgi:hypothetical protein
MGLNTSEKNRLNVTVLFKKIWKKTLKNISGKSRCMKENSDFFVFDLAGF